MDKTEKEILDFATRLHAESSITGIIRVVRDYFRQMDKVNQLKAENEELKTGLKQIQKQFGIEILYCKTTGESTFRSREILKLKQALKEIKEIAEQINDECEYNCFASCAKKAKKQILQKISEVIDENE